MIHSSSLVLDKEAEWREGFSVGALVLIHYESEAFDTNSWFWWSNTYIWFHICTIYVQYVNIQFCDLRLFIRHADCGVTLYTIGPILFTLDELAPLHHHNLPCFCWPQLCWTFKEVDYSSNTILSLKSAFRLKMKTISLQSTIHLLNENCLPPCISRLSLKNCSEPVADCLLNHT